MGTFRIHPDGSITTDDVDSAIALSQRLSASPYPQRTAIMNTPDGFVRVGTVAAANVPVAAEPSEQPPPKGHTQALMEQLVVHARDNADTIGILRTLQGAKGTWVTKDDLQRAALPPNPSVIPNPGRLILNPRNAETWVPAPRQSWPNRSATRCHAIR